MGGIKMKLQGFSANTICLRTQERSRASNITEEKIHGKQ
jgi:hypothetical protein